MKILQINKFYHQQGRSGGTGRYLLSLIELLKSKDHSIQVFSMQDKDCLPSSYSSYFVKEQDFSQPRVGFRVVAQAIRFVYSFEARKKIKKLIEKEQPDLVHLHNIYHHITPSILPVLKKRKIPIVQTLHDFHLISPNYNLYFKDNIHEQCSHGKYWRAISHKCVKDSRLASFLLVLRMYFEKFTRIYLKNIDLFIAPSSFLKKKYVENGFPPHKIVVLKPFISLKKYKPRLSPGDYVLYFGRLHPQKGVQLLIEAASSLENIPFKIVGAGKDKESLVGLIQEKKLKNVEMVGPKYGNALIDIIRNAAFVVVPSLSYENAPYTVLEAFALGKPVIASNLGGLPELVRDQKTGLLFNPGDKDDLKEKIVSLFFNSCLIRTMGLQARLLVEKSFSLESHYEGLMEIYKKAKDKSILL